jgi:hypothetical protein
VDPQMLLVHMAHMVNARVADARQVAAVVAHHLMHAPLPPRTDRGHVATQLTAFLANRVAALAADPKLPAPPSRAGAPPPARHESALSDPARQSRSTPRH